MNLHVLIDVAVSEGVEVWPTSSVRVKSTKKLMKKKNKYGPKLEITPKGRQNKFTRKGAQLKPAAVFVAATDSSDEELSTDSLAEYKPRKPRQSPNDDSAGRTRHNLTATEYHVLERAYKNNRYPTREQYKDLQCQLEWPSMDRVAKWFNNRRYSDRLRHR